MADIIMPKSLPCQFNEAWLGTCGKPSDNGWCSEHEHVKCVSCGVHAVKSCDHTNGAFACDAPLCATCAHSMSGEGHVTGEVFASQAKAYQQEQEAQERSRTSPVRRLDASGNPLNLFELLKGNWKSEGFRLEKCYYLELDHGLMGMFPAIITSDKESVVVLDLELLFDVWGMLPPRASKVSSFTGYVNVEKGVAYADTADEHNQTNRVALKILNRATFAELAQQNGSFGWAPGLVGAYVTDEVFHATICRARERLRLAGTSTSSQTP